MKLLSISIHGRELVRGPVAGTPVLIGRSPICDIVLRAPKINPVHFLLEKLDLGRGEEEWSVFIISPGERGHEKKVAENVIGSGLVLGEEPVRVGEIEFKWVVDRLTETQLEGGALRDHLLAIKAKGGLEGQESSEKLLEVITLNNETDSVSQVQHYRLRGRTAMFAPIPSRREFRVQWHLNNNLNIVEFEPKGSMQAQKVLSRSGESGGDMVRNLAQGEMVLFHEEEADYFLRFVPRIEVPPLRRQLWSDPFYRNWLMGSVIFLIFLLWLQTLPTVRISTQRELPGRVAVIKRPPPPPPPPAPTPLPDEIKEVKAQPSEPVPKKEEVKELPVAEKPKPESKKQVEKEPKAGGKQLIAGDPEKKVKKDISSLGIFGGIKGPKRGATLKADDVSVGSLAKPLAGKEGGILVTRSEGIDVRLAGGNPIGSGKGLSSNLKGLKSDIAYTDDTNVGRGAIGSHFREGDLQIGFGGSGSEDFPGESGADEEVTGGLDKESIRRTLATKKRDIRTCYEKALQTQSKIGGRIVYHWQITPDGRTQWVNMKMTSVAVPKLELCVKEVIAGITWPRAENGQSTIVIYPFQFQSAK